MLAVSSTGRKLVMALTGQLMFVFLIAHMIGNSTIYFGRLNAYAASLHALPFLLWPFRICMATTLSFHIFFGAILTIENKAAKPRGYVVSSRQNATFSGRNMIWTGVLIGAFLAYHLMHFTLQVVEPASSAFRNHDALNMPDVVQMLVRSFQQADIAFLYGVAAAVLMLHLSHGIQSSFQTMGLNNDRTMPVFMKGGWAAAVFVFFGYAAIPAAIILGMVR